MEPLFQMFSRSTQHSRRAAYNDRFMRTQISTQTSSLLVSSSAARRNQLFIPLIVLVWAVIYLGSLFQPPLMDDADTVHAEAAREMVEHNDWVTLKINGGFRYLEKAPLMYWLVAASFKIFGVHDWSARLPIALGMLALLLVVYRIGQTGFMAMKAAYTPRWRWLQDLGRSSIRGS